MSFVAWTPIIESNGPLIFSVLVRPQQKLDTDIYVHLLSERIQRMFDRISVDRAEVLHQCQYTLEVGGAWPGPMSLRPGEEANDLIASNPSMIRRLEMHDLPIDRWHSMHPIETLAARKEIRADKEEPLVRLESWISAVAMMP